MGSIDDATFSFSSTLRRTPPALPYRNIKEAVLGKRYQLSVVCVGEQRARTLNRTWRKKDAVASVLAFPLDGSAGEVYLCIPLLARRARGWYRGSVKSAVGHHFIHGLLHLKGYAHGSTMEKREQTLCARFGIHYPDCLRR